jgi:hypothetical protein
MRRNSFRRPGWLYAPHAAAVAQYVTHDHTDDHGDRDCAADDASAADAHAVRKPARFNRTRQGMTLPRLRAALLWSCAIATFAWALLLIPTLLWWKESLTWVIIMSWWANVASSGAFWWAILTFKAVERSSSNGGDESG